MVLIQGQKRDNLGEKGGRSRLEQYKFYFENFSYKIRNDIMNNYSNWIRSLLPLIVQNYQLEVENIVMNLNTQQGTMQFQLQ